jgi:hypothetical protein
MIQMIWTCTGGYCLTTESSPVTLDLVSTSTHSSFSYSPSSPTQSVFSNWPGPMPDGTWSVQMKYIDTNGVAYLSSTILTVQTSTETVPPIVTSPSANTTTNATSIPIAYALDSTPGIAADPTLTFTNTTTSAASVLQVSPSVTSGSFNLNPANLAASASVLHVTGPTSLADGTYNVSMTYADSQGHPAATTTNDNWTLDRTTTPPTLSGPTTGATESGPFDVTFDLTQAAQSGSVELTFTGGAWPIALSLGDTAAGVHTISIDPNDLSSDSDVTNASWNWLTAGTYDMSVSYQDSLGNPAANSGATPLTIAAPPASLTTGATTTSATSAAQPTSAAPTPTTPTETPAPITTPVELSSGILSARFATLSRQRIRTSLEVPAAGDVNIIATAADPHIPWASISSASAGDGAPLPLHPGWHRFTFASVTATKTHGGRYSFTLTPTLRGELLIRRHRRHGWGLHVRLTVAYRGAGGQWVIDKHVIEILRARTARR